MGTVLYCPACDCWGIVPDKDGKCDCGNTVWFHDDYQGGYESADGTKTVCKCQGLPKPDDEMTEDEEEEETEEPEEVPAPAAEPAEAQPFVLVDWIIAYESGQLEDDRIVEGFQHMIDDGTVWQFQGSYGRMATALIEAGYCHQ
jgi:hypothetical protein